MIDSSPSRQRASADDAAGNSPGNLDAQIHAAELAVIERDVRVRRGVDTITQRVRRKGGIALALTGSGAFLLTRLLRRRQRSPNGEPARPRGSLFKAWAMLWSLLPAAAQRALPGGAAGRLVAVALPLLGQLFVERQAAGAGNRSDGLPAVISAESIDLARYLGRWYEIARLPTANEKRCVADVVTAYADAGRGLISVVNNCRRRNGRSASVRGVARVVEGSGNARLKVSFAPSLLRSLPLAWRDYWVLVTADDYRYALVGTPDRRRLWLLSRSPVLSDADRQRLVDHARSQGYDTAALVSTPCLGGDVQR